MHDPAELYLPDGQSLHIDLVALRSQLPACLLPELSSDHASWRAAAILWSRSYGNYEHREFFLAAAESRSGFGIHRPDPLAQALRWLQQVGAVIRWHQDERGLP